MKASSLQLRRSAYWLLTSRGGVHEVFLTFGGREAGDEIRTLPVFSAERMAGAFMESGPLDGEVWRARKATCGELISILYGPCETIGRVALDPVTAAGLQDAEPLQTTLSSTGFVEVLLGRGRHWFEENPVSGALPTDGPQAALDEVGVN